MFLIELRNHLHKFLLILAANSMIVPKEQCFLKWTLFYRIDSGIRISDL